MMTLSVVFKAIRAAWRRASPPTPAGTPVRLKVLFAILVLLAIVAGASQIRTWRFERQLRTIAEGIVAETNTADKTLSDLGNPGTNTTCDVFASSKYLLFGPVTGKIVFLITPLCNDEHSTDQIRLACAICSGDATHELDYVYVRGGDGWVFQESFMHRVAGEHR